MKVALALVLTALLVTSAAGQSAEPEEAARLNAEVVRLYAAGKYEEALVAAQRVLALREKELGRTHKLVADALVNLAAVEGRLGKTGDARGRYERAIDIFEKGGDEATRSLITAIDGLARLEPDILRAAELHRRSLKLKEKTFGPESAEAASTIFKLGHLAELLDRGEEAERHFRRFLEIAEKTKAGAEDDIAVAYLRLACVAGRNGKRDEADVFEARASEVFKRVADKRPPVEGGVVNGKTVSKPQPFYPAEAKRARAEGTIRVEILIGETGVVLSACAQKSEGHASLKRSSEFAAYGARFTPTLVNDKPVKVKGVITYRFVLQ